MPLTYFLVLLLARVRTEEVATPASLLGPRNFNHHAYPTQYLQETEPTKQGPVLFPNDSPPPPRPPLIVTSRPLIESLARSGLNLPNNSIAEQSQIDRVSSKPDVYRTKNIPLGYSVTPIPTNYDYSSGVPYADVVKKARVNGLHGDNRYNDYEEQTVLPQIYKALSDHSQRKVLKLKQTQPDYDYQTKDYTDRYQKNRDNVGNDDYNNYGQNYAFSYTVKDHKTGDDFSHSQQSSGSATNGEYRVRLPDGRMQIVSYTADENGYKADVRYDDEDKAAENSIDKQYNNNGNNYDGPSNDNHKNYGSKNYDYNDYGQRDYKPVIQNYKPANNKNYNQYTDVSKEYNSDDYSQEYGKDYNYKPYKSKFSTIIDSKNPQNNIGVIIPNQFKINNYNTASTVKPSYEEIKHLFITKRPETVTAAPTYIYNKIPIEFNVPSTTPSPNTFNVPTTEHVVLIGQTKKNLFTNIRSSVPSVSVTPVPIAFSTPSTFVLPTTPKSYLVSTVASLNNVNLSGPKPVLSRSFIDRINKYLTFK